MITRRALTPLILTLIIVLGGCAVFGGHSRWDPFRTSEERQLRVRVDNVTHRDVVIHVLVAGHRTRLGRVPSRSAQMFGVPLSSAQEVRFQLDPVGDRRHTTDGMLVGPSEVLELIVLQPVSRSVVRR